MNQYLTCPCGKGKISRSIWKNQWGKTSENILIACEECQKKYRTHALGKGLVLLVPKEYDVEYNGYMMEDDYPYSKPYTTTRFDLYLIENYTRQELRDAAKDIDEHKSSKKLETEVANRLVDEFSRNKGSKKMRLVKETICSALDAYDSYQYGTKEQRTAARKAEQANREKHAHDIEDVSIKYDFRDIPEKAEQ